MEIESKRDVGTTIIISLPISEEELMFETNETRNNLTLPVDIQLDASIFDGNVILVVDDDILIRENISYMISQYTTVITASNGKEAIEMAQKNMPDIIISDIEMPEMDGIEMCSILHKDPQFNHIPILFVSACTEESRRLSGYLHGAIDYITKPFNKKELLIKLSNILSVRQEQQRRYIEQFQANQIKDEAVIEEVNPFVAHFMEVLEECYTESQVSVELLAQKMNVSQSTLNRKLRTLTSQSPIILLTEYRLKKAKEILAIWQEFKSARNRNEVLNIVENSKLNFKVKYITCEYCGVENDIAKNTCEKINKRWVFSIDFSINNCIMLLFRRRTLQ